MRSLVLAASALVVAATAAAASPAPALRLTHAKPLVVAGSHFKSNERVVVTLSSTDKTVHVVRATAGGTFSVDFGTVHTDRCLGWAVTAVGRAGSRATLKLPLPACMPQASPGRNP